MPQLEGFLKACENKSKERFKEMAIAFRLQNAKDNDFKKVISK